MKSYLTRLAAGTLLLFLALFGGLYSLFTPFALTARGEFLFPFCLLAALAGAAVHAMPEGRAHRLTSLLLWVGLLLVLWRGWEVLFAGAQVVFHQVSLGYHQQLPAILYYELPTPLLWAGAETLAWDSTLFLTFALFPVALWLGQWLLRGWPVWPGLGLLCALPGLGILILRQPHPLSLAACLFALALILLSRRGYQEDPHLGSRRVLVALLPLGLTMVLLALLLPQGSYVRPLWVEELRQQLKHMDLPLSTAALSGGRSVPGAQSFSRFGPPRFDGHTVLIVEAQDTPPDAPLLLRGFSSGVYTSSGWQPCPEEPDDNRSSSLLFPALAVLGEDDDHDDQVAPEEEDALTACRSLTVTDVDTGSSYYYRPYFPVSYPYNAAQLRDAYLTRPKEVDSYQITYLPQEEVPAGAQVEQKQEEEARYRHWVYEHYLDVPADLLTPEALEIIEQGAAVGAQGAHSYVDYRSAVIARGKAVADYLASFTRYDLFASSAPLGEDTISYFLTTSRRGYCVHYATAATLILREMGLPARFAAGYSVELGGKLGPVEVADRNAHAWVEVYVDGFGWQPVDVTPPGYPGSGTEAQASQAPSSAPSPSAEPSPSASPGPTSTTQSTATPSPSQIPGGPTGGGEPLGRLGHGLLALLPWLLGLCLVVAGVALQRRWRLGRRCRACTQPSSNAAVLELYGYLLAAQRRHGVAAPQSALELAQKAAFSQHVLTEEERRRMEAMAQNTRAALLAAPWYKRLLLQYLWALC